MIRRADSSEKTLIMRKTKAKSRREQQGLRWLHSITVSMDINLSKLQERVARETWCAIVSEVTKSQTWLCKWTTVVISVYLWFGSVQLSCSVVSNSLWPHERQHTRLPSPSPALRVHPKPCLSSRWCHSTISSSVVPFSSWLQSFPASRSFPMSQLFISGGQSIGVSASASVLPLNTQDWFPLG